MPRCRPAAPPSIIADEHAEAGAPPAWRRAALPVAPAAGRRGPRLRPVGFVAGSPPRRLGAPERKPSK